MNFVGPTDRREPATEPRLGIRPNQFQFVVFTFVTFLVGATIGIERVAVPPLARQAFGVTSILYTVSFLSAFGLVKSVMNLVSGRLSDGRGRKPLLVVGWAFGVPYALLIVFANAWWEIVVANLFLGVNQALTWTMSVTAKIDLVGPRRRGLAVGIDESAGYLGVGAGGYAAGLVVSAYGLRPAPYLVALGVILVGSMLSAVVASETLPWARSESKNHTPGGTDGSAPGSVSSPSVVSLLKFMSWQDRSMFSICQAGMVNKFADTLVASFFPVYLLHRGMSLPQVGRLVGVYAGVWGLGQVLSGALADRIGRKAPITSGTFLIAAGLAGFAATNLRPAYLSGAASMGLGMALAYPNLLTAVGDTADPSWRGGALGVYRLWRDGGYAVGPIVLGAVAAAGGITAALWTGAGLLLVSGLLLATLFRETGPRSASNR